MPPNLQLCYQTSKYLLGCLAQLIGVYNSTLTIAVSMDSNTELCRWSEPGFRGLAAPACVAAEQTLAARYNCGFGLDTA